MRPASCMRWLCRIDATNEQTARVNFMERRPHVANAQRHSKSDFPHERWQLWIIFVGKCHPSRRHTHRPIDRAENFSWASDSLHAAVRGLQLLFTPN